MNRATRVAILDALTWFSREGSAGDVRILFLSGHGERSGRGNDYYFCSYEHDPEEAMADMYDIRWNTILDSLTSVPGKAVLMVDTCHAGRPAARAPAGCVQ